LPAKATSQPPHLSWLSRSTVGAGLPAKATSQPPLSRGCPDLLWSRPASSHSFTGVHLWEVGWLSGRLRRQAGSYSLIGVHLWEMGWL